jgi:hypothetical protein
VNAARRPRRNDAWPPNSKRQRNRLPPRSRTRWGAPWRLATGGGTVLTTMSQLMAQRCVRDPIMRSLPGRFPSRPGAIDLRNTRPSDGSRSKGFGGRRAPRSCSVIPHTIPVRGAPVPLPRAGHTPASTAAISGASAVSRGFRPASLPTAATRDRRRLSLLATMRQEVLGMRGDPDVRQERLQVHLLRREAGGGLVRKSEIRRSRSRREACRTGLTTVLADRVARFGLIDRSHLGSTGFGVVGPK